METMFFFSSQVFPQKHGFSTVFWGYVQYMRSTPYFWRRIRIQREKIQKKSIVSIPEPTVFFVGLCNYWIYNEKLKKKLFVLNIRYIIPTIRTEIYKKKYIFNKQNKTKNTQTTQKKTKIKLKHRVW